MLSPCRAGKRVSVAAAYAPPDITRPRMPADNAAAQRSEERRRAMEFSFDRLGSSPRTLSHMDPARGARFRRPTGWTRILTSRRQRRQHESASAAGRGASAARTTADRTAVRWPLQPGLGYPLGGFLTDSPRV